MSSFRLGAQCTRWKIIFLLVLALVQVPESHAKIMCYKKRSCLPEIKETKHVSIYFENISKELKMLSFFAFIAKSVKKYPKKCPKKSGFFMDKNMQKYISIIFFCRHKYKNLEPNPEII